MFAGTIMLDQNNTPAPPETELKFQMQVMTQMMKTMTFVMGNVCERLDRVEKHGNKAGTSTQDMRKVRAEPKANNGSRAECPRWADYENFEEDVDDTSDGSFEDEAIDYRECF
jgi:hypothetical protein